MQMLVICILCYTPGPGFVIYCCKLCSFLSQQSNFKFKCSHASLICRLFCVLWKCVVLFRQSFVFHCLHSTFSTLLIFHTLYFLHSLFSTLPFSTVLIFCTPDFRILILHRTSPHFPHSSFPHPHLPHSSLFTLLIFHTHIFHATHFPHALFPTLFIAHTPRFPHPIFHSPHFSHSRFSTFPILHRTYFMCTINFLFAFWKYVCVIRVKIEIRRD